MRARARELCPGSCADGSRLLSHGTPFTNHGEVVEGFYCTFPVCKNVPHSLRHPLIAGVIKLDFGSRHGHADLLATFDSHRGTSK